VFDIFDDKKILDNYQTAHEKQKNTEHELKNINLDLDHLRTQTETKHMKTDNYLEWKQHSDETHALKTEIVPRLEITELSHNIEDEHNKLTQLREDLHHLKIEHDFGF